MCLTRNLLLVILLHTATQGHEGRVTAPGVTLFDGSDERLDKIMELLSKNTSAWAGGGISMDLPSTVLGFLLAELQTMRSRVSLLERTQQGEHRDLTASVQALQTKLHNVRALYEEVTRQRHSHQAPAVGGQGSTYIRWGRKSCPTNNTLVYTGIAGGRSYSQKGSGSNRLCLTNRPQFDGTPLPSLDLVAYLYGSEYKHIGNHHDQDVPCSVCLTPQVATIMIPATLTCPPGWTPQYSGHLVAERYDHFSSEYVCLDGSPEAYDSGFRNDNGLLFYYVLTVCGSLPCPPYVSNSLVTCVVCSK